MYHIACSVVTHERLLNDFSPCLMFPAMFCPMVGDELYVPNVSPTFAMFPQCFQACAPALGSSGAIRFSTLNAVSTGRSALLRVHGAISVGSNDPRGELDWNATTAKFAVIRGFNGKIACRRRIFMDFPLECVESTPQFHNWLVVSCCFNIPCST